jgi:hypothetical protein
MCDVCTYQQTRLTVYQINQYDPTRTTALRNRFVKDMRRRFKELTRLIVEAIVAQDCFGLQPQRYQLTPPGRKAFNFARSQDKVQAFMDWLNQQRDKGLLQTGEFIQLGQPIDRAWTNQYITDSYKRGVQRARYEMNRAGVMNVPSLEQSGGIESVLANPVHLDRIGVLYTRVYEELKGISSQMSTQISRVLSQGMIDGDNPRLLARKLVGTINGSGMGDLGLTDTLGRFIPAQRRAEVMARTEMIRSHHQATIQEYRNWGLEGVKIQAEVRTAGDDRVCEECQRKAIAGPYTLDQVENMIPIHPQCRCIALPVFDNKTK